jgi:hypothetical protein
MLLLLLLQKTWPVCMSISVPPLVCLTCAWCFVNAPAQVEPHQPSQADPGCTTACSLLLLLLACSQPLRWPLPLPLLHFTVPTSSAITLITCTLSCCTLRLLLPLLQGPLLSDHVLLPMLAVLCITHLLLHCLRWLLLLLLLLVSLNLCEVMVLRCDFA